MDLSELSRQQEEAKRRTAQRLLDAGVILDDWTTLNILGELTCSPGVRLASHVVIEGTVTLGGGVRVGCYTYLRDVTVRADTEIRPFSSLEGVEIGENCRIGPYARIRDGCEIGAGSSVGNFVELKATAVGARGRINHLAFLGDAELESDVTIGAGVITCNHDGVKTVGTSFCRGAFVGCGTQLVAPVTVGQDATIAAGSTITKNVEPGGLTVARARQVRVAHWKRRADSGS